MMIEIPMPKIKDRDYNFFNDFVLEVIISSMIIYKGKKMKMDLENLVLRVSFEIGIEKMRKFGFPCGIDVAHIFLCEPNPPITAKHTCV